MRLGVALGLTCAVLASWAVPDAAAHDDVAVMTLESALPTQDGESVTVEVSMRFSSDDHPVLEAAIELAGSNDLGITLMPLRLRAGDEQGTYAVTAPIGSEGVWSLRLTSTEPDARLEFDYDPQDPSATPTELSATSEVVDRPDRHIPVMWIALGCGLVALIAVADRIRRSRGAASAGR